MSFIRPGTPSFWRKNTVPTRPVELIPDHPLARGLVGLWIPGIGNLDYSLSGNNIGTLTGSPPVIGSQSGPAMNFSGAQKAQMVSPNGPPALTGLTVCALMTPAVTSRGDAVTNWTNGTGNSEFDLLYGATAGAPQFFIGNASPFSSGPSSIIMAVGHEYYVSGTYDGATVAVYVGGVLGNSAANAGGFGSGAAIPVTLGNNTNGDGPYKGSLGSASIYRVAQPPAMLAWLAAEPFAMLRERAPPILYSFAGGGGGGTTVVLVGAAATTAAGAFASVLSFPLTGASAAATAGALSIAETIHLTGAAAAAAAGTLSIAETVPFTGAAAAAAAGRFALSESFTLSPATAAATAGALTASTGTVVPLTGAAAAAAAGRFALSESFTLSPATATAAAGILTASTGTVVPLTGAAATAAAAPLGIADVTALAGAAASATAGVFSVADALALAGAAAATTAGTLLPYTGTVLLQGAVAVTAAGIILVETVNPATMTVLVSFTILPSTLPAPNPVPVTGPGDVLVTFGT